MEDNIIKKTLTLNNKTFEIVVEAKTTNLFLALVKNENTGRFSCYTYVNKKSLMNTKGSNYTTAKTKEELLEGLVTYITSVES